MALESTAATARIAVDVSYDPAATDAESVAAALDALIEMALSTPGITDDYGGFDVGSAAVIADPADNSLPMPPPAYAARGGMACPYCGSPDIEGGRPDADGPEAVADEWCNACRRAYQSVWHPVNYRAV